MYLCIAMLVLLFKFHVSFEKAANILQEYYGNLKKVSATNSKVIFQKLRVQYSHSVFFTHYRYTAGLFCRRFVQLNNLCTRTSQVDHMSPMLRSIFKKSYLAYSGEYEPFVVSPWIPFPVPSSWIPYPPLGQSCEPKSTWSWPSPPC